METKGTNNISDEAPVWIRIESSGAIAALKASKCQCHICNKWKDLLIDCSYPDVTKDFSTPPNPDNNFTTGRFIRICAGCIMMFNIIIQVAKDHKESQEETSDVCTDS